ncbi:sensor histidine kinase [Ruania halotolerans]|uniref:sensor histidine kinase n=1 Tax=Ruania halotolerans TaxID=2897773 RepID=UPI001E3A258F|nr:histidine kinase [Ruania halotolerans]UFU07439.1 histidine kinase [Ruania halotolerans]
MPGHAWLTQALQAARPGWSNEPTALLNPTAVLAADENYRMSRLRRYFALHPRAMDVLLMAIFAVPNLVFRGFVTPMFAGFGLIVASALALLWRRSHPWPALVALTVFTMTSTLLIGDSGGIELGVAFALYTVVTLRGPRPGWLAFAAATLSTSLAFMLWGLPQPGQISAQPDDLASRVGVMAVNAVGVLILLLIAMAIGVSVRNRREQLQRLIDQANQYRLESEQREQLATADERARIAREMHDVVAHSLSVMVALADGAKASLTKAPQRSDEALGELSRTGRAALADMRRILGVLRMEGRTDADLEPQPGVPALEDLLDRFRAAGLDVRLRHTGPPVPADAGIQLTLYRIVQEGLTNVLRHAPGAGRIVVTVLRGEGALTATVQNDRPAGSAETRAGSGQGLIGMRERAATYGGTVEAGPDGSGGWRMRATLFFDEEPAPSTET